MIKRLVYACMVMAFANSAAAEKIGIAAVVDEQVITTMDVAARRDLIIATAGIPDTPQNQKKITPRIVQSLIDETLQLQEAKRQSLSVTDEELNKAIDALGTRGESKETIREFVKRRGLSVQSLENQMRAQLAWTKVVQRKLRRNVSVAKDEIERAQKAASTAPGEPEIRIQALELDLTDAAARESLVKLADDIVLELRAGAEMSAIALRHIKLPSVKYSQPSWVPEKDLPPLLQQTLRGLKSGEVTPALRSENAIQILQVMDRHVAPKLDDATEYMIKQMAIRTPKKRDKAGFAKLQAAAQKLHGDYGSCDDQAVPNVGLPVEVKLMRLRYGAMSPQQRGMIARLEVGDISEPLMAPDALRFLVVCEKIEPSISSSASAEAIRQQLFAEKIELEAQKHLRNLRRDAYIDIKDASE